METSDYWAKVLRDSGFTQMLALVSKLVAFLESCKSPPPLPQLVAISETELDKTPSPCHEQRRGPLALDLFAQLPLEIGSYIVDLAASQSQESYRSLRLTSFSFNEIILRNRTLQRVPICITKAKQLQPFWDFLNAHPDRVDDVQHLWILPDHDLSYHAFRLQLDILQRCTQLISLACLPDVLFDFLSQRLQKHTNLRNLTVKGWIIHESIVKSFYAGPSIYPILSQVENLHIISGLGSPRLWPIPTCVFTNLRRLSYSIGCDTSLDPWHFKNLDSLPRLEKVGIVTRQPPQSSEAEQLAESVRALGERYSLHYRQKRYKEMKGFANNISDPEHLWKLQDITRRSQEPAPCS